MNGGGASFCRAIRSVLFTYTGYDRLRKENISHGKGESQWTNRMTDFSPANLREWTRME